MTNSSTTYFAKDSRFIASSSHIGDAIIPTTSEIAILGRSNVGKSSFINMLLSAKLAKSSSMPGKTRLVNFFNSTFASKENNPNLPQSMQIVVLDFPGFGYAKVSKDTKSSWDKLLDEFIKKRKSIKLFIHLVDSRHPLLPMDAKISEYLNSNISGDQKILKIFTKSDKLSKNDFAKLRNQFKNCDFISNILSNYNQEEISKLRTKIIENLLGM